MSLVFLKNATTAGSDGHMKPYSWSNNFDTPLVLPPDSQVAYISSTMQKEKTIILEEGNDLLWFQIGNMQLNLPMPMYLTSPNGLAEDWSAVAARIKNNGYVGKTDFMYDGQTGGYGGVYNAVTDKLTISCTQRLQPTLQDVWANRGESLSAAWVGLNETNVITSTPASNTNGNVVLKGFLAGAVPTANLWNCGWGQIDLAAGGLNVGDPTEFEVSNYSLARSDTGIKRAVYEANSNGDILGGALQFRGQNNAGAPASSATSQALPYICGLNSIQCIKAADATTPPGGFKFVDFTFINSGSPAFGTGFAPNVVQVRITDQQEIVVECMSNTEPQIFPGVQIRNGAWGNCIDYGGGNEAGIKEMEKFSIADWLATALNQPQNTGAEASQPYNARGALATEQITFSIQWTTPYTFQVWAGTGFSETTGRWEGTAAGTTNYVIGTPYENTYTIIYDSQTGGTFTNGLVADVTKTMYVPEYFGDLGMCLYTDRRNRLNYRGNFDVIRCYKDTPTGKYQTYDNMLRGIDGINWAGNPPSELYPNCYHLLTYQVDNIFPAITPAELDTFSIPTAPSVAATKGYVDSLASCVSGILTQAGSVANYQRWYPQPEALGDVYATFAPILTKPDVDTGVVIGLIAPGSDGESDSASSLPNNFITLVYEPVAAVGETDQVQSVHIQLTNLPINGRNGMTSTKTGTIAVVHNAKAILAGTTRIFENYQPEKNWIDLNNAAEMTINELRVFVSDDANQPARFLNGKSDVLVMFRQKPAADRGISTQPINKFGMLPGTGQTTIKM